jgi:hypothetical protein
MEPLQRSDVIQLTQDLDNPVLSLNEGALNLRFDGKSYHYAYLEFD